MRHSLVRLCPVGGLPGYVQMRRPSIVRNLVQAAQMYFSIVLRDFHGARIGPITAAKVCWIVYGDYARDFRVWRRGLRVPEPARQA